MRYWYPEGGPQGTPEEVPDYGLGASGDNRVVGQLPSPEEGCGGGEEVGATAEVGDPPAGEPARGSGQDS